MPREFSRTRRVEEQLRRDLAELIRHEIKEPGLGMVSISEIKVSPDLSVAQIYVSIMQDDREIIDHTMQTLHDYAGKLRGLLGKRMHIRRVPQLNFLYDDLIQKGTQLDKVIENAVEQDRQKADQFHTDPENGEDDNG
jgi:ribosome-binding factor A